MRYWLITSMVRKARNKAKVNEMNVVVKSVTMAMAEYLFQQYCNEKNLRVIYIDLSRLSDEEFLMLKGFVITLHEQKGQDIDW